MVQSVTQLWHRCAWLMVAHVQRCFQVRSEHTRLLLTHQTRMPAAEHTADMSRKASTCNCRTMSDWDAVRQVTHHLHGEGQHNGGLYGQRTRPIEPLIFSVSDSGCCEFCLSLDATGLLRTPLGCSIAHSRATSTTMFFVMTHVRGSSPNPGKYSLLFLIMKLIFNF